MSMENPDLVVFALVLIGIVSMALIAWEVKRGKPSTLRIDKSGTPAEARKVIGRIQKREER